MMKRLIAILALVCAAAVMWPTAVAAADGPSVNSGKGEKTIGLQGGYFGYNRSGIAGLIFTYRFSDHFRLSPSVMYVFRHNNTDALTLNLNAHFPIAMGTRAEFFPLAGVNLSSWSVYDPTDNDASSRRQRIGLNVGAGVMGAVTDRMRVGAVAEYTFVDTFAGVSIRALITYRF